MKKKEKTKCKYCGLKKYHTLYWFEKLFYKRLEERERVEKLRQQ